MISCRKLPLSLLSFCGALLVASTLGAAEPSLVPMGPDGSLTDAKAQRLLAGIPGIDPTQVWRVTGMEHRDDTRPGCLSGRDIWMYTKPVPASQPGLWRGKKGYVTQEAPADGSCGTSKNLAIKGKAALDMDTASFIDPSELGSKATWDGQVPGLFNLYDGLSDAELLQLRDSITQVGACLQSSGQCPFAIGTTRLTHTDHGSLVRAIRVAQLASVHLKAPQPADTRCYGMLFVRELPYIATVGMSLCYRGGALSEVSLSDLSVG